MKDIPNAYTRAAIAIGGNEGEVQRTFKRALSRLEKVPGVTVCRRSTWIETEPVGGPAGQPMFWNGAVTVETKLSARELLSALQSIEAHFGRDRDQEVSDGPRTLDLDLILYGDASISEPGLQVPHPRFTERRFVLEPLVQIAADWMVPDTSGAPRTVEQHWQNLLAQA